MDIVEIIWFTAAFLTTISFLPQDVKVIKTHDTHAISLPMFILITWGILLWFIYGLLIVSYPIIVANAISLAFSLIILYYKIKYK